MYNHVSICITISASCSAALEVKPSKMVYMCKSQRSLLSCKEFQQSERTHALRLLINRKKYFVKQLFSSLNHHFYNVCVQIKIYCVTQAQFQQQVDTFGQIKTN